jgi:hypothetical protein
MNCWERFEKKAWDMRAMAAVEYISRGGIEELAYRQALARHKLSKLLILLNK